MITQNNETEEFFVIPIFEALTMTSLNLQELYSWKHATRTLAMINYDESMTLIMTDDVKPLSWKLIIK